MAPFFVQILTLSALLAAAPATSQAVCVSGVGGYVATELVKQLLESGYHVKGTVRSLQRKDKFEHLQRLDAALPGTLELLEADLLEPGSFDACAIGSKYVFHTASPVTWNSDEPWKSVIEPAVNGTENVLMSAIRAKTERVILTSSIAAMAHQPMVPGRFYSEEDWNDLDESMWRDNDFMPYMASKTLAERKAWELGKEHGITVVAILPAVTFGPVHTLRADSTCQTTELMKTMVEGEPWSLPMLFCDNRDVAKAHIQAAVNSGASGRYVVAHPELIPPSFVHSILSTAFPRFVWPKSEDAPLVPILNNSRIVSLIGGLYPLEDTLLDMVRSMISTNVATPQVAKSEL